MIAAKHPLKTARTAATSNRRLLWPIALATIISIAIVGFGLFWSAGRSDTISVERQVRTVQRAVQTSLADIQLQQETVAVWDDLVVKLRAPELDAAWIDANIGLWLHKLFGHDRVFLVNAQDRIVYAMVDGRRVQEDLRDQNAPGLAPLLASLRAKDRNLPRARPVMGDGQIDVPFASDLIIIEGRPAAVSAMLVLPLTGDVSDQPGTRPILLSVRYLDGSFREALARDYLLARPHFSTGSHVSPGEASLPLRNRSGRVVTWFFWSPELPGSAIAAVLVPLGSASVLVIAGVMFVLGRRLIANTNELRAAILRLQTSEAQAHHLAFHDPLTGLPNRAKFNDHFDHALVEARRGRSCALILMDLDRFKHVNDNFGHLAGDVLIKEFGCRLSRLLGERDMIARLGGDEFALLIDGASSVAGVDRLCEQIRQTVNQPFEVLNNQAHVGVSMGVILAPLGGTERTELLRKADIALYAAKGEGRDCHRHFSPAMDASVRFRAEIEEDLREALANGTGLSMNYQPLVNEHGRMVGVEALLRWEHPQRGAVSPAQLIPIAEETGLISPLGDWILEQACRASLAWPDLFVAVNLSPVQFRSPHFADRVIGIVESCGADPKKIELEVTEGVLIDDDENVRSALRRLRSAGLRIALDDFGTGYSSLSYLRRFDVDKIKIDRSFIQHLGHAVDSAAIITAVITLGHAMGLTVTAEGVETDEQLRFLRESGCNELQGYYFSAPVPAADVEALAARDKAIDRVA
ncbi:periplasmic sensor diguanylate cyclase/phosphodiesterase [Sphingomonas sp. OV641]|uniref:putative bifunctional diguanylate cyclase/phosphodiesterase n=1 Tax=Sphingomonas sp. OV641 TaxID=1881068 RepID=UPI0008C01466|nr:EAL domain-containing protein [Sphingomonas sp. OV641]SEI78845.1 periplasmic sensor diguanylate cyclase/phosphodiesterase [Sphingomonas sp. OV641]